MVLPRCVVNAEASDALAPFLAMLKSAPESVDFEDTMAAVEAGYEYTPVAFSCGEVRSTSDQNQGSAKIFSFAKLNSLDTEQTLQLFGRFYRKDVLENPDGSDHGNIRNFIQGGWDAVAFPEGLALEEK